MPPAFYILFGALFTVAVSMALGKLLLRRWSLRFYREEEHLLTFITGAAILSAITFALCALGVARKGVFLAVGLMVLTLAFRRGAQRPRGGRLPALSPFWKWLFAGVFAAYLVLYFFNAMAPEISPDGSSYHLGFVARYQREHGFHRITTNMYANLSQGIEMLFLFAFAFGRHSAASLVHFAFLVTLPLAMLCYARRFGFSSAGACGALFVFVSPVVGIDGISAYLDVAVAAIGFTLFYLLQIWDHERVNGLLAPIGLLAGFGYAAKHTAFLGVPYALAFVACKSDRKHRLKHVLPVAAGALLMMLPWLLKNWVWARNPFSPFLNAMFPNPQVTIAFEQDYLQYFRHYDLQSYAEVPLETTTRGALAGIVGPLFWLAPLGLLALRRRAGRQLLLAALVFGIGYAANIGARFLIPALPFVSLALAMALGSVKGLAPSLAAAHAVLSWPSIMPAYCRSTAWRLADIPLRAALRIEPEETFLFARLPNYGIARVIERVAPRGAKVLTFSQVPEAYTTRDILVAYQAASNNVLGDILWTPLMPERAPTWLLRFRFPAQKLRRVRVVQTARGQRDQWSVSELRVFLGEKELPRASTWSLRAKPNPWDVRLAFDNSPVTRWRSGQTLFPGMFLELDFRQPETADSVLLQCSPDQWTVRLKLEGQDTAGNWKTLAGAPEEDQAAPLPGMRRAAVAELKRRGIGYIMLYDSDFAAQDYQTNQGLWGIQQAGESGAAKLYRLL